MQKIALALALIFTLTSCGSDYDSKPKIEILCEHRFSEITAYYGEPLETTLEEDCESFDMDWSKEKPVSWCKVMKFKKDGKDIKIYLFPSSENKCCSAGETL